MNVKFISKWLIARRFKKHKHNLYQSSFAYGYFCLYPECDFFLKAEDCFEGGSDQ
jgi:hypothetical protein